MAKKIQQEIEAAEAAVETAVEKAVQTVETTVKAKVQALKVDFDAWWAMVEKKIPLQHKKEIILADFKARGLSLKETMESYYEALKKYGVKLK